ncbi:short chain dehydrogenase reductase [Dactylonectria macrodidyma]|uniref:Short chain dehydrogenase reductase n=1 Tax=Dactylonectria macrodidyma TaxID=307937 RepID=A0A9P9EBL4_9HYPO|nr:short chain dehydrogenase reductase [Dactylonectria macrodidyma]
MSVQPYKKSVLITGCSPGGIGCALAQEFKARNCNVIATARKPEALAELAALGLTAVRLDVDDEDSINDCKAQVEEITGGELDILVNNAGVRYVMPLTDAAPDRVRSVFETNVISVMTLTNKMMPLLLASEGLIVNISSYSDRLGYPFKGVYAMSKAALSSYSQNLSIELAHYNVRVLNVVTSFVSSKGQSGVAEPWPQDSLFDSMRGAGQQAGSGKRMSAEEYATHVVTESLRGKGWSFGPWRFFGTRETMRIGTMCTKMWLLEMLGYGWIRFMMLRSWPFWKLRDALQNKKSN